MGCPLGPRGLSCLACTLSLSVGSPRAASISYLLGIPMSDAGSGPSDSLSVLVTSADVLRSPTSPCLGRLASSAWNFLSLLSCLFGSWILQHRDPQSPPLPLCCVPITSLHLLTIALDHNVWQWLVFIFLPNLKAETIFHLRISFYTEFAK